MLDCAHEFLAHDGSHRASEKTELKGARDHIKSGQLSGHDHERIALSGLLLSLYQRVLVTLGGLEFKGILGFDLRGDLRHRSGIEESHDPVAAIDAHVVA